jgi:hypothetical protein
MNTMPELVSTDLPLPPLVSKIVLMSPAADVALTEGQGIKYFCQSHSQTQFNSLDHVTLLVLINLVINK